VRGNGDTAIKSSGLSSVCRAVAMKCLSAAVVVFALLIFASGQPAQARYASIVVDADTGRILHGTNIDTRNYPASLTKMMTLYMVFDALEAGELTLQTRLKISRRAARQPASRLGLKRGSTIRVGDAILALVTKSANDVATTIAENMAGSERGFALKMTARARELGMSRTTFRNASGLPHRGQLSTARDMAKLARALINDHHRYYHFFATTKFRYAGLTHRNHNKLLTTYEGTDGIKTGYIRAAGFNLVASVKRDDQRLIGVVFGGDSARKRNRHMTSLLNKGFRTLDSRTVIAKAVPRAKPKAAPKSAPTKAPVKQQPVIVASAKHKWGVQVGAFARHTQAFDAARDAVDVAPNYLKQGHIKVVPLKKRSGRTLHRARIHGITKKQAYRACRYLKKKRRDCMELKLKKPVQVAQNRN